MIEAFEFFAQTEHLSLQRMVPHLELVDSLVPAMSVLVLFQLLLQPLDVLFCALPDCALGFPVIGPFPGKLRGRECRHAAST